MEAVLAVRREQLQRIFPEQLARVRALPRRHVFDYGRPLGIVQSLETVALEFELARLGLQPLEELQRVVGGKRVRLRNVLLAAFPEPAKRDGRAQMLLLRRHDEVPAANEFLPRHHLGQVGRLEQALDPIDLVHAFREVVSEAEALTDLVEDPVI
jgi:hypothetical protein